MSSDQDLKVSAPTGNEPVVTLKQAVFAMLLLIPYVIGTLVILGVLGAVGVIDLTPEALLPAGLGGMTLAVMLALYLHLVRRNSLTLADLGFRRPGRKMLHLLWQIPAVMAVGYSVQGLFLGLLTNSGVDTTEAGTGNGALADIVNLSVPMIAIVALSIAVLTPIWEEVLFRVAFLDGFTRRFGLVAGILLSSALFAAVHMIPLNLLYLFIMGIALALLRRFHQNIWAPILLHAANNGFAVFILFMAI